MGREAALARPPVWPCRGQTGQAAMKEETTLDFNIGAARLVAALRFEGLCALAPGLSHSGRSRTRRGNGCHLAAVQRRPEDDDANGHQQAGQAATDWLADGRTGVFDLRRALRDRAHRERCSHPPFGRVPGHRRGLGGPHDAQRAAADDADTGCRVPRASAPAIAPSGAIHAPAKTPPQITARWPCGQ